MLEYKSHYRKILFYIKLNFINRYSTSSSWNSSSNLKCFYILTPRNFVNLTKHLAMFLVNFQFLSYCPKHFVMFMILGLIFNFITTTFNPLNLYWRQELTLSLDFVFGFSFLCCRGKWTLTWLSLKCPWSRFVLHSLNLGVFFCIFVSNFKGFF